MSWEELRAIDVHVHAEVSCRQPHDPIQAEFEKAASEYFKAELKRPTIAETVELYREQNIGFVMFTVDSESATQDKQRGDRRGGGGEQRHHGRVRLD